ncbi:hypothetical protein J6590_068604 [Homalodisca vitripennis]|nr:hypothetical protein J6590_068604 [Homalodisca vitripennis]
MKVSIDYSVAMLFYRGYAHHVSYGLDPVVACVTWELPFTCVTHPVSSGLLVLSFPDPTTKLAAGEVNVSRIRTHPDRLQALVYHPSAAQHLPHKVIGAVIRPEHSRWTCEGMSGRESCGPSPTGRHHQLAVDHDRKARTTL